MSSRVQKGGQKFKPVAKPRGRPAELVSRNASSAPETTQIAFHSKPPSTVKSHSRSDYRVAKPLSSLPSAPEEVEESSTSTLLVESINAIAEPQTQAVNLENTGGRDAAPTAMIAGRPSFSTQGISVFAATQEPARLLAVPITISARESPFVNHNAQPVAIPRPSRIFSELDPGSQSLLQNTYLDSSGQPVEALRILSQVTHVHVLPGEKSSSDLQAEPSTGSSMASALAQTKHLRGSPERQQKPRRRNKTSQTKGSVGVVGGNVNQNKSKRRRRSVTQQSVNEGNSDAEASGTDHNGSEHESQGPQKRRRRSTTVSSTRMRRSRTSSVPVFDPDADPGEELDPTVVTMAAICDDTGQGRLSSKAVIIQNNHLAWKAANKEKRARMHSVMEAKKYGRKEDEAEGGETGYSEARKEDNIDDNASQVGESSSNSAANDAGGSGFNYRETLATNRFNAQVRIGPDGETIIDEESLYVDRAENEDNSVDQYQHVEESDQTKFTNSASYGRKLRGSRWSAEETELFYDALSQFGENYELISYVLPGRDRKSCKNKFKAEDKKNANRITFCLNNRVPYDMQTLSRLTGKDFSGPTPEIRAPKVATLVEESQEVQAEPEELPRKIRTRQKKSRTPAADVEVVGDVETFDLGSDN
ncbi:hypothetical protein EW145_g1896 [Phellinidium pouzarii]|uniref:Uncharacterized protein n=1 Tax=Phellinidium pouzarii TaxID=167371 RepID=A0A4S4LEJ0_9AGAM|nr:hypothetical protein EW145_g1896 [Phellinidium pouzarii]